VTPRYYCICLWYCIQGDILTSLCQLLLALADRRGYVPKPMAMSRSTLKLPEELDKLLFASSSRDASSSSSSISLPSLSSFSSLTYVHPNVEISTTQHNNNVTHGRGLIVKEEAASSSQNNNINHNNNNHILAGDVLFVTPPTVDASVEAALRVYMAKGGRTVSLQDIAETLLLKEMKRVLRNNSINNNNKKKNSSQKVAASFVVLQSQHLQNETTSDKQQQEQSSSSSSSPVVDDKDKLLSILLGNGDEDTVKKLLNDGKYTLLNNNNDEWLRGIIRQNAFGPDFHHYARIQDEMASQDPSRHNNCSKSYTRILGMYPLAAMINHSCTTNATRIFVPVLVGNNNHNNTTTTTTTTIVNLMVAIATQDMAPGQEITWSYISPIQGRAERQAALSHYGFTCHCPRCCCIRDHDHDHYQQQWDNDDNDDDNDNKDRIFAAQLLRGCSDGKRSAKEADNNQQEEEVILRRHSLRVSLTQQYMNYFNQELSQLLLLQQQQQQPSTTGPSASLEEAQAQQQRQQQQQQQLYTRYKEILQHATSLHESFVVIHNASTEHVSIVHLCYELATKLASLVLPKNNNSNNTNASSSNDGRQEEEAEEEKEEFHDDDDEKIMLSTAYWMKALQRVHQCRYSKYVVVDTDNNNNTNNAEALAVTRKLLQHTKLVLRTPQGWHQAKHRFI
jgi:SET domain